MADPYKAARTGSKRARSILKSSGGDIGADATPFSTAAQRGKRTTGKAAAKEMRSMESQAKVPGRKGAKRFARGGKIKRGKGQTNIAIVVPHHGAGAAPPMPGGPPGGPMPPPMAGPGGPPPMGAPPGMRPGMPPQGMARGGHVMTAGALSGVGREEKAGLAKRRRG